MLTTTLLPLLFLAATNVAAKGCATHTFTQCADGITHWYDPDDGQICDPLDCGGGRAPPKTTDPCCGGYKGTVSCVKTPTPSYLPCFAGLAKSTSSVVVSKTLTASAATTTPASGASGSAVRTTGPGSSTAVGGAATTTATASATGSSGAAATRSGPAAGNGTVVAGPSGNATLSVAPAPSQASNAASAMRYDLFVAVAGAVVGGFRLRL
jgi:hypothetical protein